jgi:hypothetical protein
MIQVGVGSTVTDQLTDAMKQLATVSTYLSAASAGNATAAQLQAAQAALTVAQADILNASGAAATSLPPGTWVKGPAAALVALGTGFAGGLAGYYVGKKKG